MKSKGDVQLKYRIFSVFAIILFILAEISFASAYEYELKYDLNGNLIQDKKYSYEYNSFNQLEKIKTLDGEVLEEYAYDENGNRILKRDYTKNEIVYYSSHDFVRVVNSSGTYDTVYVYVNNELLARKDFNGKRYFYHPDHLGSTNLVTDENGNLVEVMEYYPYGEEISGESERFGYTGKELDTSGLMYYGARYYSPAYGQFTQPDTIIQDIYDPQALNRYAYARNNPLKYTDPTGHIWDIVFDIGFIVYDAYKLVTDFSLANLGYLSLDVGCAFIPFVTGAGISARVAKYSAKYGDNVVGGVRGAKAAGNAVKSADKVNDARRAGNLAKTIDSQRVLDNVKKVVIGKRNTNVYVKSYDEAFEVMKQAEKSFDKPLIKVRGPGPNSIRGEMVKTPPGTWRSDFLKNPLTGKLYAHDSVPFTNPHSTNPHITINNPLTSNEVHIIIEDLAK